METSRRAFIGGAAGLALAGPFARATAADLPPSLSPALEAIRAYAEEHRRYWNLPALTLSVILPDGASAVIDSGLASPEARSAITPATLFQIGSISKCMTAASLHQMAAEGRLSLAADVRELLPGAPWPVETPIAVQQLLDHVSGLPGDAPAFPTDMRLWLGFRPGEHWAYSNTGYTLLGLLAERIDGRPLARILHDRLFAPLGMTLSRGAISEADRTLYAVGYQPADQEHPIIRGGPLAAAAWVNETSGAGSVASTAADMALFLRSLAGAAQGRGGLGLSAAEASAYAGHAVASDSAEMRYGNGLMHRTDDGRALLHHTGGMVAFSSAFHLDVADGIGAFASSTISGFAEYRPRAVTLFAVKALRAAHAGRDIPSPPPLAAPIERRDALPFVGRYAAGERGFEIAYAGNGLSVTAAGREAPLEVSDDDVLKTGHPDLAAWPIRFERERGRIVAAGWGPDTFVRDGSGYSPSASDPVLARLAGRYVNDSPWWGVARIVERGGRLWLGGAAPMTPIADGLWRVGKDSWSPERASFANPIGGRPRTLIFAAERFERRDI